MMIKGTTMMEDFLEDQSKSHARLTDFCNWAIQYSVNANTDEYLRSMSELLFSLCADIKVSQDDGTGVCGKMASNILDFAHHLRDDIDRWTAAVDEEEVREYRALARRTQSDLLDSLRRFDKNCAWTEFASWIGMRTNYMPPPDQPIVSAAIRPQGAAMYKYDFGLSFAGEDRAHAKKLAEILKSEDVRVFYDQDEEADMWGSDLYQKFQQTYGRECRFFIPFISKNYLSKRWPMHELKQAQARDFKSDAEYILPLRLDDSKLPGINETTGYIDLRTRSIESVAKLCLDKLILNEPVRRLYLFLRNSNPDSVGSFAARPGKLVIRVAVAKAKELTSLLSKIDSAICYGIDQHNTLMNGGDGPQGVVRSVDAEPHTTFELVFSAAYYDQIPV
jgi:hypothetical protein